MKVGILGGTFDPIHEGHIHLAKEALKVLELDKVLFVPANRSPFKTNQVLTDAKDRLKMVELALTGETGMEVSDIEIQAGAVTYTIDTLRKLKAAFPEDTDLFLLLGADTFQGLGQWKETGQIGDYCEIAVAARPGYEVKGARLFTSRMIPHSATEIRQELEAGRRPEGLADSVWNYIQERGLYKNG